MVGIIGIILIMDMVTALIIGAITHIMVTTISLEEIIEEMYHTMLVPEE